MLLQFFAVRFLIAFPLYFTTFFASLSSRERRKGTGKGGRRERERGTRRRGKNFHSLSSTFSSFHASLLLRFRRRRLRGPHPGLPVLPRQPPLVQGPQELRSRAGPEAQGVAEAPAAVGGLLGRRRGGRRCCVSALALATGPPAPVHEGRGPACRITLQPLAAKGVEEKRVCEQKFENCFYLLAEKKNKKNTPLSLLPPPRNKKPLLSLLADISSPAPSLLSLLFLYFPPSSSARVEHLVPVWLLLLFRIFKEREGERES